MRPWNFAHVFNVPLPSLFRMGFFLFFPRQIFRLLLFFGDIHVKIPADCALYIFSYFCPEAALEIYDPSEWEKLARLLSVGWFKVSKTCGGDFPRVGVKNLVKCPKSGKYEPKNKRTGRNGLSAINLEVDAVVPYYLSMYSLYSYAYKLEVRVSLSIRTPPSWRCVCPRFYVRLQPGGARFFGGGLRYATQVL